MTPFYLYIFTFRTDCTVEPGDTLNLIIDDKTKREFVKVGLKQNVFIAHPDILISGTTVSNALGCLRRAVLQERFKVMVNKWSAYTLIVFPVYHVLQKVLFNSVSDLKQCNECMSVW